MKIVFATNNKNKLIEVNNLLPESYELLGLSDIGCTEEIPEEMPTLEGNSFEKASYIYQNYQYDCFADDTGLEIEALNGEPGVFSARYAGLPSNPLKNIEKVLKLLENHENKNAQFRTIFTCILNGNIFQFEGIVKGKIINELRGKDGFGYDPVFIPDGYTETFAEMPLELKNRISHRGLATLKLINFLSDYELYNTKKCKM